MLGGGRNPAVLSRRDGADDESSRRVVEGHGEEDHLVGGGGNHRGDGPNHAPMAGAIGEGWLYWLGRPAEGQTERAANPCGHGGGGLAAVSRGVLRPEHPAFSRKAGGRARYPVALHLGAEGAARSRPGGQTAQAGAAPAEATATAGAGDAAAHRRQQASLVER